MESRFPHQTVQRASALAVAALSPLLAAPAHDGPIAACGTPRSAEQVLFLHQQHLHITGRTDRGKSTEAVNRHGDWQPFPLAPESPRNLQVNAPSPTRSGEIALIESAPALLLAPNPVDLSGRVVTITPGPSGIAVEGSAMPAGTTIEWTGIPIVLDDDDAAVVEFPFAFPYYGEEFERGFLHSDGNFTFLFPEASRRERNYSRAVGGPPRIAPFFQDLDPSEGGQVLVSVQGLSVTVTWHRVPLWRETGIGSNQTFQMILKADGTIEFRYGTLDSPHGVVGIFPGPADREAVYLDWSDTAADVVPQDAIIAEVFSDTEGMDEFAVLQDFYRHHEDAYDTLILFNDLDIDASAASLAHAWVVRNEVRGTGDTLVNYGDYFGSPKRLSAFVNMGPISQYPPSALAPIRSLPDDSSLLTILAHELGHRFLAYARWRDPASGLDTWDLLGRQRSHWSFYFNSGASVLEGNAIEDHGQSASPRFQTVASSQGYSQLDRYLMGLVNPSEVRSTFLVQNAKGGAHLGTASRSPESGVWFDGERTEVRIEDIIAATGERRPDWTVSQRHFRYAFALLVKDADSVDPDSIRRLNQLRMNWLAYARVQLGAAASTATELVRMLHLSTFPAGGLVKGESGTARVIISEARKTDLTVMLDLREAIAAVPRSVVIRAGDVFAEFSITGSAAGTTTLTARAAEPGFDTAVTRLNVRESLSGLKLLGPPPVVFGVAGTPASEPLNYRVIDENLVPYSGIELEFASSASGSRDIPNAVTDFSGRARIKWPLADQAAAQVLKATVKGEPSAFALTRASVAERQPSLVASGIVNAASGEAPSAGRGFAPGSLVTIQGAGLAADTAQADSLLVFRNPTLPTRLGGTTVQVGGVRSPLLAVAPGEVTFQIPFGVPEGSTRIVVATPYGRSEFIGIQISPVQPGLFPERAGAAGRVGVVGPAVSTGPPAAGSDLYAYATGLGAVTPPAMTGHSGQALPPNRVTGTTTAWVDGRSVAVRSSTLALFEAGVYEIVIPLPDDLPAGTHILKIAVDGVESNEVPFVTR